MERRNEMGIIVTACAHIQQHSKEMVSLPYFDFNIKIIDSG